MSILSFLFKPKKEMAKKNTKRVKLVNIPLRNMPKIEL